MSHRPFSIAVVILATLSCCNASFFNSEPQLTIETESNKAFDDNCLIGTFEITNGDIGKCLAHCLENCSCQSFQICQETTCQLCSSNKEDNSSLIREKGGCIYAMYKRRHLEKTNDQCSSNCFMRYNCCQLQPDVCPKNKICKPIVSLEKPWKRFLCCPAPGYHGDNCEKPIRSCQGYSNGSRTSGMYKVLDSAGSLYEVYCHFDLDGAWTLVQSYSFGNRNVTAFKKPLTDNFPHGENALSWEAYRLSHVRMTSIKEDYAFIRFTCDFEKYSSPDIKNSDYLQVKPEDFWSGFDVLSSKAIYYLHNTSHRGGKIGEERLDLCNISLHQDSSRPLHAHVWYTHSKCTFLPSPNKEKDCNTVVKLLYFGKFYDDCFDKNHRCVTNDTSTTQLWFGHA